MDFDAATFLQLQWDAEEDDYYDDTIQESCIAIIVIVCFGAEESRQARIRFRQPRRLYLCRPQLLHDPMVGTPWQILFQSRSDRAYITTMGFNVDGFQRLLNAGFAWRWYSRPIPRGDVHMGGAPRPRKRSLDAEGALGLVLHYLNSTAREIELQQIFALIPSTVSRYISFALEILLETLKGMPETCIRWPEGTGEFEELRDLIIERHPLLLGAFATIDGLNLPVQTSADLDIENATYNGWLSEHFVSSVLVFSPKGTIIAARLNAPGSWHDSRIAQPIYVKLLENTPAGYYLVADTAFPRGNNQIRGRIRAPLKAGQAIPGTHADVQEVLAFNRQLLSYRQTAEWGMRALQGTFGRLRVPLEINHVERQADLLETCVRLHNFRTEAVGINQIRTVYMPNWDVDPDLTTWAPFEDMLFSDQRKNDRVARFHIVANYE
ncbi:hypothetical protein BD410DRAFT_843265 [Rickenella mellea]|uniref:DDE Tnp4 domain-containing protein n=1 Tax=Rickenella mellea TaxID=50990 RepID=A0A4Y7PS04_9AGAM|nr:hypothetical protein BD410DRAFT_843265 [Rickenella mellea]